MPSITLGGGCIHYNRSDPPAAAAPLPTIVFVHGVGADSAIWRDWRALLSGRFDTIAIDLPGHGKSFRPGAAFNWSFDDLAEMVHRTARAAAAERLILIGESVGGTICLAAAAGRPEVAAVITCSTAHMGAALRNVGEWRALMASEGLAGWSEMMLEKRFWPDQCDDERIAWFDAAQRASDGETILALADLLVGLDLTDRLPEIRCPVLLIQPDGSPFIPLELPLALKRGLARAELMVIPGTRHGIACSHAGPCAEAAGAFLDRYGLV